MLNGCAAGETGVIVPAATLSMVLTTIVSIVKEGDNIKSMSPKHRSSRFALLSIFGKHCTLQFRQLRRRCTESTSFTRH